MDMKVVKDLTKLMRDNDLVELEVESTDLKVRLTKNRSASELVQMVQAQPAVASPLLLPQPQPPSPLLLPRPPKTFPVVRRSPRPFQVRFTCVQILTPTRTSLSATRWLTAKWCA